MKFQDIFQTSIPEVLDTYFKSPEDEQFIIVIGANNGGMKDFLSDYLPMKNMRGILVEPIKHLFSELQDRFQEQDRLQLENSAIYKRNCKKNIYRVQPTEDLPAWINGLGSFNRKIVAQHQVDISDIQKLIIKEQVNCITFSSLLKKYEVGRINVLQIDTEGSDYDILSLLDFNVIRPDIIIFEYMHLTTYQYYAAINLLEQNNYNVNKNRDSLDAIAIDNDIL